MRLKQVIKNWLAKRGYFLFWVPDGEPTGISLEVDLLRVMKTAMPVVLDVGANVGQTIDLILEKYPAAKIIAFEASGRVCSQLKATHGHLCRQIHHVALSTDDGVQEFINYDASVFSSLLRLKPSEMHQLPELKELEVETVCVRKLDSMMSELKIDSIDLLKIDTQGNDLNVLRGAATLLLRGSIKHVLIELNFFQMYEGEGDALAIIAFLKKHHYHLVEIYEKNRSDRIITWCTGLFEHDDVRTSVVTGK